MQRNHQHWASKLDHDVIIDHVVKATGLPRETVEDLQFTDEALVDLCDTVLSDLALPEEEVSRSVG